MKPTAKPVPTGKKSQPTKLIAPKPHKKAPKVKVHKPTRPAPPVVNPLDLPVAQGSPTTYRQLGTQADNAAAVKYGGAERQIGNAGVSTNRWFNSYQQDLERLKAAQQTRQDTTAGLLKGIGEGSAALSVADATRVANAQATDAAQRGATASADVKSTAIQAARNRDSLNAAYQSVSAIQGQNADNYAGQRVASAGQGKLEALGRLQVQGQNLQQEKGAYKASYLDQAKGAERTYGLNMLAAQLAGVKVQDAATTAATKQAETVRSHKANEKNTASNPSRQKSAADLAFFKIHGYYPPTGPPKNPKGSGKDKFGNTPKQRQANNDTWSKAKTTAGFYWSHGAASFNNRWQELADFLVTSKNVNPLYAKAAAQRIVLGHVDAKLGKQLGQRGVKAKIFQAVGNPNIPAGKI